MDEVTLSPSIHRGVRRHRRLTSSFTTVSESDLPLAALCGDSCLCVITQIDGASYRPLGASMAVDVEGRRTGSLSSGCIDADVAHHAVEALRSGICKTIKYGSGSNFFDIQLPCGGGLDITLIPRPDGCVLRRLTTQLAERREAEMVVTSDGRVCAGDPAASGLHVRILPRLRVVIFGTGPEPKALASLATAARQMVGLYKTWPEGLKCDGRTAIAIFFHDHDKEIPILRQGLASSAFYIGAQGSLRAKNARAAALHREGLDHSKLVEPFGLIHAKDPHTLAVGVLAQILGFAALAEPG